jgi:hypothetical protein
VGRLEEGRVLAEGQPAAPTLADQVTRLYELIAGYHATNLLEVARELGVWEALTRDPGRTSEELAARLGTQPFYTDVLCRTAFSFGLLDRDGAGWRMAPHFDQILGNPESSFYLACAPRVHMVLGDDYPATPTASAPAPPGPTRSTTRPSCARWPRR